MTAVPLAVPLAVTLLVPPPPDPPGATPRTPPTKRQTLAHVVVCLGCCCGRTDRGRPEVPSDWLRAEWKARKLLKHVQLTIAGCLGPCDVPNVAAVHHAAGTTWLAHLTERAHFEALLAWADATAAAGRVPPLPAPLGAHAFERFLPPA